MCAPLVSLRRPFVGLALIAVVVAGCSAATHSELAAPTGTAVPRAIPSLAATLSPTATPFPVTSPAANPSGWTALTDPHWSGYTFPTSGVTGVRAQWREPLVTGSPGMEEFTWVGIGGWDETGSNLIQVGTFAYFPPAGGIHQGIWYETLPPNLAQFPLINVHPGDQIFASIELTQTNPQTWHMLLVDANNQTSFDQIVAYQSVQKYADYVVEAPNETQSNGPPYYPLPHFAAVTFGNMQVRLGASWVSADALYSYQITMQRGADVLVQPGPLASASFTDTQP
jgi:hypothetical protein